MAPVPAAQLPMAARQGSAGSGQGCACRRPTLETAPGTVWGTWASGQGPGHPARSAPDRHRGENWMGPSTHRGPRQRWRPPGCAASAGGAPSQTPRGREQPPLGTSLTAQPLFPRPSPTARRGRSPASRRPPGNSSDIKVLRQPPLLRAVPATFHVPPLMWCEREVLGGGERELVIKEMAPGRKLQLTPYGTQGWDASTPRASCPTPRGGAGSTTGARSWGSRAPPRGCTGVKTGAVSRCAEGNAVPGSSGAGSPPALLFPGAPSAEGAPTWDPPRGPLGNRAPDKQPH